MVDSPVKELIVKDFTFEIKEMDKVFDVYIKINKKTPKALLGEISDFCLDPSEFLKTIEILEKNKKGHRYDIFTCGCGDAGCDGWFKGIYVDIESDNIIWLIDEEEKLKIPIKLKFNIEQYKQRHAELLGKLNALYLKKGDIYIDHPIGPSLKTLLTMNQSKA